MDIYRKIWEQFNGPIPKDHQGRSFEIHHIDGNRKNNDISNLKCVSIQEHYDIHYSQKDYGACYLIAKKMKMDMKDLSSIASKSALKAAKKRVEEGTHQFLKRLDGSSVSSDRVKNGTCPLSKRIDGTSVASDRVKNKTHPFLRGNKKQLTCPHCGKTMDCGNYARYHGDKCKKKKEDP